MFIDAKHDQKLKDQINEINWSDFCDDATKYQNDVTYSNKIKQDIYDKLSVEMVDYADKITNPLLIAGFHRKVNDCNYYHYIGNVVFTLCYKITYTENEKTNPFEMNINIWARLINKTIQYEWYIEMPCRIYYKRSLNWASRNYCNSKLFTSRGFKKISYQRYKWTGNESDWFNQSKTCKELINKIKSSINSVQTSNERIQKSATIKKSEMNAQIDFVTGVLENINDKVKDTNIRLMLNGECGFDYVDSPIVFPIAYTNNPKQNSDVLSIDRNEPIYVYEDEYEGKDLKPKLFTDSFIYTSTYYRSHTSISLTYIPHDEYHWKIQLNYPCSDTIIKNFLNINCVEKFKNLDEVENFIINLIEKDHSLYNAIENWKNGND